LGGQGTVINGDEWLSIGIELSTPDTLIEVGCSGGTTACVGASVVVQDFEGRLIMRFVDPGTTDQASTLNVNVDFCCESNSGSTDSVLYDINGVVITTFTDQDIAYAGGTPVGWIETDFGFDAIYVIEFDSDPIQIPNRATFSVIKDFSDDNPTPVEVGITCNTGLPLEQSFVITDEDANAPSFTSVTFVVTEFIDGAMDCTVYETETDNYTVSYSASGESESSIDGGCVFSNISLGDDNACTITNTANPGTFTAWKEWNIINDGGDEVNEYVGVTIACDSEIFTPGAYESNDTWYLGGVIGDGGHLTASVDTTEGSATCGATESVATSGVESSDNCEQRSIDAGGSSSCTFVNTVFFEGIPTLSQYGLAIMALLMLGLGMVGFRRFA
jgi:hypothetical protein